MCEAAGTWVLMYRPQRVRAVRPVVRGALGLSEQLRGAAPKGQGWEVSSWCHRGQPEGGEPAEGIPDALPACGWLESFSAEPGAELPIPGSI